ncbi:MAG: hypothetical protein OC190_00195 [Novosphingobium aromaticivorans]|nr:hypothetical protein [Novosphingobium aromaticivorans]
MGYLRRVHEWAADKGWAQYPEPEWRVQRRRERGDWLDTAFKLTVAGFLIGPIIAPVLLGILVLIVIAIGW